MLVSYKCLQHRYFNNKLPDINKVAEAISLKSFEVEGVTKIGHGDWVIDIDVLPNRAHDCLSYDGIAKEISIIFNLPISKKDIQFIPGDFQTNYRVEIESDQCRRYTTREFKNLKVSSSPRELKDFLESIGQKSINNVVDITNMVMYLTGQPMHAFDADKISGEGIFIRKAHDQEKITTLDKKEVVLDDSALVIADQDSALAIAGIKGGTKAEVNEQTVNIILESANFNPTSTRKTSKKIGVQTDSSKRFENELTPELTKKAIDLATELIMNYCKTGQTQISDIIDSYPKPWRLYRTGVSLAEINSVLGSSFSETEVSEVFERMDLDSALVNPRQIITEVGFQLVGSPYKYGSSVFFDAPHQFDCSSFVCYLYSLAGYSIPRITADQYVFAYSVEKAELLPGDLIFANTGITENVIYYESVEFLPKTKIESGVDHVGIYLGDNKILHATSYKDSGVIIENLDESERFKNIVGYRRIINSEDQRFAITIPAERLDLKDGVDLIEEVARIIGYNQIAEKSIEDFDFKPEINKIYSLSNTIRKVLKSRGFSEVITYTLCSEGEVEPEKPIAEDKKFLRNNLGFGMNQVFEKNINNADLLAKDHLKIFEIGKVFHKDSENNALSLGVINNRNIKKPKASEILGETLDYLAAELKVDFGDTIKFYGKDEQIVEINLDLLISKFNLDLELVSLEQLPDGHKYQNFSVYPFLLRDLAVWVPNDVNSEQILEIVKAHSKGLIINSKLFDVYQKDDKTSYAFRLVFQSMNKTLTDNEANQIMDHITKIMNRQKGWEVR